MFEDINLKQKYQMNSCQLLAITVAAAENEQRNLSTTTQKWMELMKGLRTEQSERQKKKQKKQLYQNITTKKPHTHTS